MEIQYKILSTLKVEETEVTTAQKLIDLGYIDGYIIQTFNGIHNEIFIMNLKGLTKKGALYLIELKQTLKSDILAFN